VSIHVFIVKYTSVLCNPTLQDKTKL